MGPYVLLMLQLVLPLVKHAKLVSPTVLKETHAQMPYVLLMSEKVKEKAKEKVKEKAREKVKEKVMVETNPAKPMKTAPMKTISAEELRSHSMKATKHTPKKWLT